MVPDGSHRAAPGTSPCRECPVLRYCSEAHGLHEIHPPRAPPVTEERDQGFLRWAPSGMLIAAVLAVGRTLGLLQAAERSLPGISPEQREILAWEHIASLPERLVQGLVLGLLAAAVTDGNLRRLLEGGDLGALEQPVASFMGRDPKTLTPKQLVEDAYRLLSSFKVDQAPVIDGDHRPVGMVDVQDILDVGV